MPSRISNINVPAQIDLPSGLGAWYKKSAPANVVSHQVMDPRDSRATVAVRPAAALAARTRLFSSLEAAFPIKFAAAPVAEPNAQIVFCSDEPSTGGDEPPGAGLPTFVIGGEGVSSPVPQQARLSSCAAVDQRVRGLAVPYRRADLELGPRDRAHVALATGPSGPVWTASSEGPPRHFLTCGLPELGPEQALRDLFVEHALAGVALVQFLRGVSDSRLFPPPKLRAVILFDDPNLRWRTYGFIDFERLHKHAGEHRYHAAMAMIPLDGWRQHRSTVDLFRRNPERLSLTLHGNNHVANELTRPMDEVSALAIAAQAMQRAKRFESRYGLAMDRVMIPPHGMCSGGIARALGALGFDALCAIHPYPWTEHPPADRPLAGWEPAEYASGCVVIPRIPFTTAFAEIAIRAFLGHPLVLYGHHDDLANGLDQLAETASLVNGLGDVEWLSLGGIAASNYSIMQEGGLIRVRPYSHRVQVDVPPGTDSLVVERPRNAGDQLAGWSVDGSSNVPFGSAIRPGPGRIGIRLNPACGVDPKKVSPPTRRVWPIVRRAATETRDRLRPLVEILSARPAADRPPEYPRPAGRNES